MHRVHKNWKAQVTNPPPQCPPPTATQSKRCGKAQPKKTKKPPAPPTSTGRKNASAPLAAGLRGGGGGETGVSTIRSVRPRIGIYFRPWLKIHAWRKRANFCTPQTVCAPRVSSPHLHQQKGAVGKCFPWVIWFIAILKKPKTRSNRLIMNHRGGGGDGKKKGKERNEKCILLLLVRFGTGQIGLRQRETILHAPLATSLFFLLDFRWK